MSLENSSAWKASPTCFLVALSRKTSNCPSAGSRGFYWPSCGCRKSWKERGEGLSQKSFGRLWPRRASAHPTLELSGCFSRGKGGAEQCSTCLEGVYAGGVNRVKQLSWGRALVPPFCYSLKGWSQALCSGLVPLSQHFPYQQVLKKKNQYCVTDRISPIIYLWKLS